MGILEKVWVLLGVAIIFLILIADPKDSTNSVTDSKLMVMFSSLTEGQRFLRQFTWVLIASFSVLTILINYINP